MADAGNIDEHDTFFLYFFFYCNFFLKMLALIDSKLVDFKI